MPTNVPDTPAVPHTPGAPESSNAPEPSGRDAVRPRLAVSVIMLRRDAAEPEVFIQNRAATMDFAAGAVVFPGGRVDRADYSTARSRPVAETIRRQHADAWQRTAVAANSGETLQEMSGVLLAAAVREVKEETGALLAAEELLPWANWITPAGSTKRFDTYFYLTVTAPSVEPRHQTTEADSSHWAPVRHVLEQNAEGRLTLMRPTHTLLTELVSVDHRADIFSTGRRIIPVGERYTDLPAGWTDQ